MLHVWRVFEGERETLAKHVRIETRSWTELDANGQDYNIACRGRMMFFEDTDTVVIVE
jgi:hypothetical protein